MKRHDLLVAQPSNCRGDDSDNPYWWAGSTAWGAQGHATGLSLAGTVASLQHTNGHSARPTTC